MIKLLITGRTSFIGGHFVEHLLLNTDWEVYSIERLPVRLAGSSRVHQLFHDIRAEVPAQIIEQVKDVDYLIHLAADVSGVKSLTDPKLSVTTNVVGTFNVLELARKLPNLEKFVQVSTGEVVGAMPFPFFADESAPLRPSNPYAASKAAAEALVNAYRVSFNVPAIIVRSMNVFGPGQSAERFVPMVVKMILEGQSFACHVDQHGSYGSRNWLHVRHLVRGLHQALKQGNVGETYHIVGPERNNYEVVNLLAKSLDRPATFRAVVPGPSHDHRYALQNTKIGLNFDCHLDEDLASTARSYL